MFFGTRPEIWWYPRSPAQIISRGEPMTTDGWTTLKELRPGAIFRTRDGTLAFKTIYRGFDQHMTECDCYLLENGEAVHFPHKDQEEVQEILGIGWLVTLLEVPEAIREAFRSVCERQRLSTPAAITCGECGSTIEPGEQVMMPPHFGHHRFCLACAETHVRFWTRTDKPAYARSFTEPPRGGCGRPYHHASCDCGGVGGDR
jgi:hypothetical protein